MLYKSKPSTVEAIQYGPTFRAGLVDEVASFIAGRPIGGSDAVGYVQPAPSWNEDETILIEAGADGAQGWVPVPVGHWIVRAPGDYTDHWPVDPDYFAAKYEPADQ